MPIRNTASTCPLDAILLDFLHNRQQEAAQGVPKQNTVGPPYPSVSSLLNPDKSASKLRLAPGPSGGAIFDVPPHAVADLPGTMTFLSVHISTIFHQ
ncbi:uncharacterized protein ASPGLDRAFT_337848 [Aspergillus glaucus CBS 516.65]|uniref:Uncharacterized protein n=1 Tax=Aspergillus glaucus CBS 516.65 TaxID=1160497 RepID=A0A1L9VIL8_ASPGL|nr:hypothetical protein ASPGLDRAFT_337848 [Aspergillus glaucus CBS 516.65]OJJ83732.1 hypothetical protein ASPGLDRAFT_337848 [Aspergillus glaucus CBS 516.65]